jgi:MFS family permease
MLDQARIESKPERNFRWNFGVNILDISFYSLAMNLVSQTTIMPVMVSLLTTSKIVIGLIPAVYSLGFLLPQLLMASYTEGLRRKKPFLMLFGGTGERLPFLMIALVLFWLAKPAPTVALALFFVFLALSAATNGLLTPAWYDLIAKVIPVKWRGIWSGVGNSLGAVMGIAGAALAGWLLVSFPFPNNYAFCFLLAGLAMGVSWLGLALNREPESQVVKTHTGLSNYFKQLPVILRKDPNYIRYLLGRSVVHIGGMSAGFITVYGLEHFHLSGIEVGGWTMVLVGSQAIMNLIWGALADRRGHKFVLCVAAFSMAATTLLTFATQSPGWLWAVFILLGVSTAADSVSNMNIIMEFCAEEDRPTYIGLTNTLLAPTKALAPILGGLLATWAGYSSMFLIAVAGSFLGGLLLTLWVREPRTHQPKMGGNSA